MYVYQGKEIPNFDPALKPKALVYVPGWIMPDACIKGVDLKQQQVLFLNDFWLLGKNVDEYYKAREFLADLLKETQELFEGTEHPPITQPQSAAG